MVTCGHAWCHVLRACLPTILDPFRQDSCHAHTDSVCALGPAIDEVRLRGDSCGGEVTCVVRRCPKGIGAPVFDKLEAELAKALMSLPATKARARFLAMVALCQTQ